MELIITKRDGTKHVVLYDECDHELISKHKWAIVSNGPHYYCTTTTKKTQKMHRMIFDVQEGRSVFVDHINHNGLDNRRANIRICTHAENARNARRSRANTTGFKGVSYRPEIGMFVARIMYQRKSRNIGVFADAREAAIAYNIAAKELFGEFAYLNPI
jgi:hypothetical protein